MIDILNNINCGISINDNNYDVCCYEDDVLLTSVTSTGLQLLIDTANSYITIVTAYALILIKLNVLFLENKC